VIVTFKAALKTHFPGALPEVDFVDQTGRALAPLGFTGSSAIACVSVCRDELTQTLVRKVSEVWGEPFTFSGLAGMLFLGKTGFGAAYAHAPQEDGKERYVHFVLPHIGVGGNGTIGVCSRPGRDEPSGACGALMAFRNELQSGQVELRLDPYDIEQSLLKQRLLRDIKYGDVPDLVQLTKVTHAALVADLEEMISLTVDSEKSDYARFNGYSDSRTG
jgi:hypothetical protein